MLPDNIDDLFRDKLDGHETPPGDALWARLQASPAAMPAADEPAAATPDCLDQLFQQGLHTHATPPGRELWERLEDEHLRPRKRRAAAWWPMALAAAVALLLIAGGAGLWLGFPSGGTQQGTVASQKPGGNRPAAGIQHGRPALGSPTKAAMPTPASQDANAAAKSPALAINSAPGTTPTASPAAVQNNSTAQATRPTALASTASKARMAAPGQSLRHPLGTSRQPDAATEPAPLVARTTARSATRPALKPLTPTAADELRPATKPETLVATSTSPKPAPVPEIVPAGTVPAASLASTSGLIMVDVRNGNPAQTRPAKTISTALADATDEPRGLGGRLLRQAGHLVRGERLSLAEATGLPENLTLRATVAGRSVSKSIQL